LNEKGLIEVALPSDLTEHGPFSPSAAAKVELEPGPPAR